MSAQSAATPHHEIERVWVLREAPVIPAGADVWEIEQGYLPLHSKGEHEQAAVGYPENQKYPEGRIRRVIEPSGAQRFFHTRKSGSGLVRIEHESTITREEFDALWPRTAGKRIAKTRYRVSDAGLVWEVDVFHDTRVDGRALVMVEVELASETQSATLPQFVAPLVIKEVTNDASYRNAALAH